VNEVAVGVAQQLHLDVPCAYHQLLEIDLVVTERRFCLAPRGRDFLGQLRLVRDDAHAAPAAAPARLEHHRITDLSCETSRRGIVSRQRRCRGHDGDARGNGEVARADLVAQPTHDLRRRADEDQARLGTCFGERGILGEKAVARMNRIDLRRLRDTHDVGDIEVSVDRRASGANEIALVRLHPMQREAVFLGIDRDRADAKLGRGAHHANGDLAAVGD
jgi:hypothetical protein